MQYRSNKPLASKTRGIRIALVFGVLSLIIACSTETRQLFFDIPPPSEQDLASETPSKGNRPAGDANNRYDYMGLAAFFPGLVGDQPPPPIEEIKQWDKIEAMMPKDEEDDVDWAAAVHQGIIRPRHGGDPRDLLATMFQWDFIIPVPPEEDDEDDEETAEADDEEEMEGNEDDALFQHSSHTQWLSCDNCHMTIYPYRRNPFTMKQKKKGESCGVCHGKVAFSLKTCGRCHPNG